MSGLYNDPRHFNSPTSVWYSLPSAVQASIPANTYVVSGPSQTKSKRRKLVEILPLCFMLRSIIIVIPLFILRNSRVLSVIAELQELLPSIINQLGPDNLAHLRKIAEQFQGETAAEEEDDDGTLPFLPQLFDYILHPFHG